MSLQRVLNARSVAIIGASLDEKKRGYRAIEVLRREKFDGDIYPVNPRVESILGLKCYAGVLDIPGEVDIALITTPAETMPAIIEECGRKGVAGVVVIAGGFAELGEKGKHLQERVTAAARAGNVRIIGPNTSGMINVRKNLNLVGVAGVPGGDIALLTQSGNMALHLITEAGLKSHKGFSYYVGVGNEADIRFHEYLEFFTGDPGTKAILMYVEGMHDGRKFLQQAYRTTLKKPIILLKSGRSTKGRKSAGSHTGALAGISEVARTAFARAGIITIEHSSELFPAAETLSSLPPIENKRIAILADGGGHATIAADVLTDFGVEIPELKKPTRELLKGILTPNASLHNPVDVAGAADVDPAVFASCARTLLGDEHIGGLLIVGLFGGYGIRFSDKLTFIEEDAAHQMGKLVAKTGKPIVVHSLYTYARPHSHELLRYYGIPVYDSLEIACRCMSVLSQYGQYLGTYHTRTNFVFNWGAKAGEEGAAIIDGALAEGRSALLEHEAKELLRLHGVPVPKEALAASADEAARVAGELGGPVALKVVSPEILHKSEAGGVMLGLATQKQVREAFREIMRSAKAFNGKADVRGCLVSPMAAEGVEVIIGTKVDEQFGPVVMFGLGGIFVEVIKDVSFRVLPIARRSARKMISELKSSPILSGVRNRPPVDRSALCDLLLTVGEIIEAYPAIREMDLNPVIARPDGATVVDARIILHRNGKPSNPPLG